MIEQAVGEQLIDMEMEIYDAYQRQEISAIEPLLAEDFCEIDDAGCFLSRAEVLEAMRDAQQVECRFERFEVRELDENCALVAYVVSIKRVKAGRQLLNRAFRSSTWRKENGSWKIIFHQATPQLT